MCKCPVCKREFKSKRTMIQHVAYLSQAAEMGMGKTKNATHLEWLRKKGYPMNYESLKELL